jgi:hypothetical protein
MRYSEMNPTDKRADTKQCRVGGINVGILGSVVTPEERP